MQILDLLSIGELRNDFYLLDDVLVRDNGPLVTCWLIYESDRFMEMNVFLFLTFTHQEEEEKKEIAQMLNL